MTKSILVFLCIFFLTTPVWTFALVDINTSGKTTLMTLSGIGDVKAQAIIDYRSANGPFATIEDIMNVSGIGTATFSNIQAFITVGSSQSATEQTGNQTQSESQPVVNSSNSGITQSAPVSSYVPPPKPTVFVDAGGDRTVIVGADTEYFGRAYNAKQEEVDLVRFMWNFGDGTTAEGPSVLHHYVYPGRYAVALTIAHDRETQAARITVTAEPARLGFNTLGDGGVSIVNKAGRDLDISRWIVRSFGRAFVLPDESIILADSSMRIPNTTLNFFSGPETELEYPNGVLALKANDTTDAHVSPTPISEPTQVDRGVTSKNATSYAQAQYLPASKSESPKTSAPVAEVDGVQQMSSSSAVLASAGLVSENSFPWWLTAVGLSVALAAIVYAVQRTKRKEWDIVEET